MGPNVTYGGGSPIRTAKVYYAGTTALKKSQPLCFVEDALPFLPESDPGFSASFTGDRGLSLGVQVEIPATASLPFFAGILADGEEGKTEAWVTILVPGPNDVLPVRVEGTTDIAVGDHLACADGVAYLTHQAYSSELSKFYAMEAFTDDEESIILAHRIN